MSKTHGFLAVIVKHFFCVLTFILLAHNCFGICDEDGSLYQYLNWNPHSQHSHSAVSVDIKKSSMPIRHVTQEALSVAMKSVEQLCELQQGIVAVPVQHDMATKSKSIASLVCVPISTSSQSEECKLIEDFDQQFLDGGCQIGQIEQSLSDYRQCPEWHKHQGILDLRQDIVEELKRGNRENYKWRYEISDEMRMYCQEYCINNDGLVLCYGNALQHIIHGEFVGIIKKSADIWRNNRLPRSGKRATAVIADFVDAGIVLNQAGQCSKALVLADACWMVLDCIQAVGEGCAQGIFSTLDDIIHPVRTAQAICDSAIICGRYIGKAIIEIGELGYCAVADMQLLHEKYALWLDSFKVIRAAIKEKRKLLNVRDVIREAAACGVQCYAPSRVLHGVGKLFKGAQKYIAHIAKQSNQAFSKAKALTTPEGIIVRIADSVDGYVKSAQQLPVKEIVVVKNMHQFFELPFGKLLAQYSQKTNYRFQQNPIYKLTKKIPGTNLNKGDLYYLDRLHLDHIEVFNQDHKVAGVYNLDGVFNMLKFESARNAGRNIRKLMKG